MAHPIPPTPGTGSGSDGSSPSPNPGPSPTASPVEMIGRKAAEPKKLPGTVNLAALGRKAAEADKARGSGDFDRLVRRLGAGGYLTAEEVTTSLSADKSRPYSVKALCPLHETSGEHDPSLNVTRKAGDDGGVLIKCHGSCDQSDVWQLVVEDDPLPKCGATRKASEGGAGGWLICALDLWNSDDGSGDRDYLRWGDQESGDDPRVAREAATYIYRDREGREVAAKVRWEGPGGKTFAWFSKGDRGGWQRKLAASIPAYRTDEIVRGDREVAVWAVEGEKDADRLAEAGLLATSMKGPQKPAEAIENLDLAGRRLVIVPDDDDMGKSLAANWKRWGQNAGADVVVLPPLGVVGRAPGSGTDVSDWLDAGGTIGELVGLVETIVASIVEPKPAPAPAPAPDDSGNDEEVSSSFTNRLGLEGEDLEKFMLDVHKQIRTDEIRDEARRLRLAAIWEPPPPTMSYSLADAAGRNYDTRKFYIDKVLAERHTVTLAGKAKSGKTTLTGNVIRSLVDRVPLLGGLESSGLLGGGRVGTWNCEMDAQDYDEYLLAMGISPQGMKQVAIQHLQGYSVNLLSDAGKEWAVAWLRDQDIEIWVPDPWSKLCSWAGVDENDNTQTKRLQVAIDEVKRQSGMKSMFIVTHPPRSADGTDGTVARTRGAAANDEWPDALWSYSRDGDQRFLKVEGRNRVSLDETALEFDPRTNLLSGLTGSRREVKRGGLAAQVLQLIEEAGEEGIKAGEIYGAMGGNRNEVSQAMQLLEKQGKAHKTKVGTAHIWEAGSGVPDWPAAGVKGA